MAGARMVLPLEKVFYGCPHRDGEKGLEAALSPTYRGAGRSEHQVRQIEELVHPDNGDDEEEAHGFEGQHAARYVKTSGHETS
jgi:hypothetical protein